MVDARWIAKQIAGRTHDRVENIGSDRRGRVVIEIDTHREPLILASPLTLGNERARHRSVRFHILAGLFAPVRVMAAPACQARYPNASRTVRRRLTCGNATS